MHVLFVDDYPDIGEVFAELARSLGHEASIATTAEGALEIAGQAGVDLIFLDIALGSVSGIDVCRELRDICPNIGVRIVAMSGFPDAREQCAAAPFDGFFLKPITMSAFEHWLSGDNMVADCEKSTPTTEH